MSKLHEVATFGEINNPETSKITIELGQPFQCPCGEEQLTSHLWMAAHWSTECVSKCERCKQRFKMKSGVVKLLGNGRWAD